MNNTIKLAVASALLATASSASAAGGIVAGDWTLDIGGIVNAYYTSTKHSGDNSGAFTAGGNANGQQNQSNITTGLLPNYLVVSGKTRQNDLDVGFTISIQPGASNTSSLDYTGSTQENRQAFITFGDASWGSIKIGKDIGIFAQDAILNDMTLLGVGSAAGTLRGNTTTLGRIGSGFIYADFKPQIAYTSPNFNGLQFTAGVTQAWDSTGDIGLGGGTSAGTGSTPAFEGKVQYAFAGDVSGKVWVSALSQKIRNAGAVATVASSTVWTPVGSSTNTSTFIPAVAGVAGHSETARAFDIGGTVSMAGFGLTGYYYDAKGLGHQYQFRGGLDASGNKRDSDGFYVQGTYTLPGVGTKLGVSYGESNLNMNTVDAAGDLTTKMWTVGAYHPLTKHLNLVAEYSDAQDKQDAHGLTAETKSKAKTVSLGAILFF